MRPRLVALLAVLLITSVTALWSQPPQAQNAPSTHQATQVAAPTTEPAVSHYTLPPDKLAKAKALYTTRTVMHFAEALYGMGILVAVLVWRLGPRLRSIAERVTRFRLLQAFLFVPLLLILLDVASLPFSIYSQHVSRAYGISVQGWGSWFWDWTKSELIGIVLLPPLVFLLYTLIRRSPKRWWLYMWLAITPIMVFVVFVSPMVFEPMFNKFEPLAKQHPDLVREIAKVTARGGLSIPPERMLLMKASEKMTVSNAYVSGIGSSQRVVVWDTTTKQMNTPQTLFVFGHEMGHYVMGHLPRGIALASLGMLAAFAIGFVVMSRLLGRFGEKWSIRELGDWASLPALLLVFSLFGFLAEPVFSTFSRYQERQADAYGLNIVEGLVSDRNQTAAQAFQVLGENGLSYPYPNRFLVFWSYSHPPIGDRIAFAVNYEKSQTAQ